MKILNKIIFTSLVLGGFAFTSCKKTIEGCTESNAINYDAKATEDDGSCKYPPACETNETGEVYFVNNSNTNSTYDVIWDGVKIATVPPNQSSQVFTYAANVQHTLVFRYTNTQNNSCNPSTPILTQCQKVWFNCTG